MPSLVAKGGAVQEASFGKSSGTQTNTNTTF